MKKMTGVLLVLLLVFSLLGCNTSSIQNSAAEAASPAPLPTGESNSAPAPAETSGVTPSSGIPNPMHESSAAEILDTLGITFHIPDTAADVSYFIIDTGSGSKTAQAVFKLDQVEYTYRIQSAPAFTDISGAYYDWTAKQPVEVGYCSGEMRYIAGEQGVCLWYDVVPGLMYSLYSETGASAEGLLALANKLFVSAEDAP